MRVYAVAGVPPEIQAYAMAKYSRSAKSMRETIDELSEQSTERFLNTYYFEYGHRSIADMAHLVFAIENISILAAVRTVDEPLWDGQERSTRYQPFSKTGYYMPEGLTRDDEEHYRLACDALFARNESLSRELFDLLIEHVRQPSDLDAASFRRTLRARDFDVARSLLPLSTMTSLGQIVSARVLERQIARLQSDPFHEVREIGARLRESCNEPAFTPAAFRGNSDPVRVAPTLVKYAQPSRYLTESRNRLRGLAVELLSSLENPDRTQLVELGASESLDDEAVATLLFSADAQGHSYRQIQMAVRAMPQKTKHEVLKAAMETRGQHDELLRELRVGHDLKFDILMDFGSFRDLHRHRRCIQIVQDPIPGHGVARADEVFTLAYGPELARRSIEAGIGRRYDEALSRGLSNADRLTHLPLVAPYALPLATKVRALFKMDVAQAIYMIELRTAPPGHFSYRHVAWEMFKQLRAHAPDLASFARPVDPSATIDLLRR